jgi:transcriptional regulator with XRE-family HTH domain
MTQVRKRQRLTQRDIADYLGVGLATVRKWEDGVALPDRSLWQRLEEAMGVPAPDPRVPEHTPAERELIDTLLLVTDELRQLREQLAKGVLPEPVTTATVADPKVVDVKGAAAYMGVSTVTPVPTLQVPCEAGPAGGSEPHQGEFEKAFV